MQWHALGGRVCNSRSHLFKGAPDLNLQVRAPGYHGGPVDGGTIGEVRVEHRRRHLERPASGGGGGCGWAFRVSSGRPGCACRCRPPCRPPWAPNSPPRAPAARPVCGLPLKRLEPPQQRAPHVLRHLPAVIYEGWGGAGRAQAEQPGEGDLPHIGVLQCRAPSDCLFRRLESGFGGQAANGAGSTTDPWSCRNSHSCAAPAWQPRMPAWRLPDAACSKVYCKEGVP